MRRAALLAVALLLLPVGSRAQNPVDPSLRVELVADGLLLPTTMAFLGRDDILVLEKASGQVRRILDGVLLADPVLDLPVNAQGERGLLGIAVNTEDPPSVFLYWVEAEDPTGTSADGGPTLGPRLDRFRWNPALGILENPSPVLELPVNPAHACHKGGVLVLGPPAPGPGAVGDGALLYTVIGDVGLSTFGPGQLVNDRNAPPPDDRAVIYRVLQDGSPALGNPFVPYCSETTTRACSEDADCPGGETCTTQVARYFAYGVRNSFGLTLDPVTGDLWDTENGPFRYDEVNRVEPGMNSGWVFLMGPDARDPQSPANLWDMPGAGSTYSDPEFSWNRTVAPTAILFPVGSALGVDYDEVSLVADNNNGNIYAFTLNATRDGFDLSGFPGLEDGVADDPVERDLVLFASGFGTVTDLEVGPDGRVYALDLRQGALYRLYRGCPPVPDECREPRGGRHSLVMLENRADDTRDRLFWHWGRGEATAKDEFGDPTRTETYSLCVYDDTGLLAELTVPPDGLCEGRPCWEETYKGFRYRDRSGSADGLQLLSLRAGRDGMAGILAWGRGPGLRLPDLGALSSPLDVQLHPSSGAVCWGARYSFPPALEHTPEVFRGRSDPEHDGHHEHHRHPWKRGWHGGERD